MPEELVAELVETVAFYADPGTWFAVMLVSDPPAGEIMEDFSDTQEDTYPLGRLHPGAKARKVMEKVYEWAETQEAL